MPIDNKWEVQTWKLSDLKPYEKNPRVNDHAVDKIAAAMSKFGFRVPIVAKSDGTIVDGHLRWKAALKMALPEVPVMLADDMTEAEIRAFRLSVNQVASLASWDYDLLEAELKRLNAETFDMSVLGFESDFLKQMLNEVFEGETDPDSAPPLPDEEQIYVQEGDIFALGAHRLICGDSTTPSVVAALLGEEKPHLMVTDPPYGVEYDPEWRKKALGQEGAGMATGKVLNDHRADWSEAWALFPGDVAYVWHGALHSAEVEQSLRNGKFQIRGQIIWVKDAFALSRGHYNWQHEPCLYAVRVEQDHEAAWYAVKDGATGKWTGDYSQSSVWQIERNKKSEGLTNHSTQKPVECMARPMKNNSLPGDSVYEPFSGSGSTIIAGQMENRRVFAVELDPAYVQCAIERWENFTGQKAKIIGGPSQHGAKGKKQDAAKPAQDLREL